jgi:hypothetical protein
MVNSGYVVLINLRVMSDESTLSFAFFGFTFVNTTFTKSKLLLMPRV